MKTISQDTINTFVGKYIDAFIPTFGLSRMNPCAVKINQDVHTLDN